MHTLDDNLRVRLLHILERSYIELAHLAMGQKFKQILALTQAVENIPTHLKRWHEDSLRQIVRDLETYQEQFAIRYEYLAILDPGYCNYEDLFD